MLPEPIKNLIDRLSQLPGMGQRSATRLAFHLLNQPAQKVLELAQAIKDLPEKTKVCQNCFNLTGEAGKCLICSNEKRQQNIICAVEDVLDIIPIERTRQFNGVYHILGGLISPAEGMTPDKLRVRELAERIKKLKNQFPALNQIEIILAFNPTTEGDTTALYLEKILSPLSIKITKLNRGLSTGSDLEYADETTLVNALKFRH